MTDAQTVYDDYVQKYGYPPKKPKYLIAHGKESDINIKFSDARKVIINKSNKNNDHIIVTKINKNVTKINKNVTKINKNVTKINNNIATNILNTKPTQMTYMYDDNNIIEIKIFINKQFTLTEHFDCKQDVCKTAEIIHKSITMSELKKDIPIAFRNVQYFKSLWNNNNYEWKVFLYDASFARNEIITDNHLNTKLKPFLSLKKTSYSLTDYLTLRVVFVEEQKQDLYPDNPMTLDPPTDNNILLAQPESDVNITEWMIDNQLSDIQHKISSTMNLQTLFDLSGDQNLRSILEALGLNSHETNRLINALNKKQNSCIQLPMQDSKIDDYHFVEEV
eukprot:305191_1